MTDIAAPTNAPTATRASTRAQGLTNHHALLGAIVGLVVPNALFATNLHPAAAAVLLAGTIGVVVFFARPLSSAPAGLLRAPLSLSRLATCLGMAGPVVLLGGESHLVFTNWDWLWRDAVLADVARTGEIPTYLVDGQTFFLRAPLGMYMLPAAVAHRAGLVAGHAVLTIQNAALLGLALYFLAALAGRRAILILAVFLAFSGLDVLGQILVWTLNGHSLAAFTLPSHIERWSLQYSSTLTQIFWVPNHALPAYWVAILALLEARGDARIEHVGLVAAASLFWSPFAVIGALPFLLAALARTAGQTLARRSFWIALVVAAGFLPIALYLQADAAQVPHAFLLKDPAMIIVIAVFLLIEIPHAFVVRLSWQALPIPIRTPTAVAILTLVCLPAFKVGTANDLVMRASIPALTILSFAFAEAMAATRRRPVLRAAGVSLALLGAVTPLQEIRRALAFPPFQISGCDLVTVWKKIGTKQPTLENYLARVDRRPGELRVGADPLDVRQNTVCWPDLAFDPRADIGHLTNEDLRRDALRYREHPL